MQQKFLLLTAALVAVLAHTSASATALLGVVAGSAARVETLPSGVRIEHITQGAGAKPTAASVVAVHYRGTLVATGAEFDSSYRRRQPAVFSLRQVIPCWTEGLQHVAVGGKAVLVCPARTAYGAAGAGGAVPPNADLRFEVELLDMR